MIQHSDDRIILARSANKRKWVVIEDKRPGYVENAMSTVLFNSVNRYVEYENCGVKYRMVRRSQCAEYSFPADAHGISISALHA